ncbi:MAG: arsenosugar biosynthesis radical SAM protein ArsS [Pirellulaceae bacterium]
MFAKMFENRYLSTLDRNLMKTLYRIGHHLASPTAQKELLASRQTSIGMSFDECLNQNGLERLNARAIDVLQINVGRVCNQVCHHCHVDAGPDRKERMGFETAKAVMDFFRANPIPTLDITGGAPEMNEHFRWLVHEATQIGRNVIDRCNLTILLAKGYEDLPEFLAEHRVRVVASLPCYLEDNCDRQRGDGVFKKSIEALQRLNGVGYGLDDGDLALDLVYNPVGNQLPPDQKKLEAGYREQLQRRFGVSFNSLLAITNMPISRFLDDLLANDRYDEYMTQLLNAFNPATVGELMCRNTLSVDWQGNLYDCDFNQMLDLRLAHGSGTTIQEADFKGLAGRPIAVGNHCFGCTAGCGSSCGGTLL